MKKLLKISPFKLSIIITITGIVVYMAGIPFLDLMELKPSTSGSNPEAAPTRPRRSFWPS